MPTGIAERVNAAIAEKVFPGCVVGIVRNGKERAVLPFGRFTYHEDASEVREDTVYDLASVTKSIPLAALVLTFIAEGELQLNDAAVKYLPGLQNDFGATIEDLLRYRVRGSRLSALKERPADDITAYVMRSGFSAPSGASEYTNLPAFLLGLILERVGGDTLDHLAEKYFFKLLHMEETTYFPSDASRVVSSEIIAGEEIRGIAHDESARVFSRAHRAVGHAGLFSTAPDLLNFLEALLRGDMPAVADGAQKGLGWEIKEPVWMGTRVSKRAFGKTGFTGTSVLCDMKRGVGLVILSNHTYPRRRPDRTVIRQFRRDIADAVFK